MRRTSYKVDELSDKPVGKCQLIESEELNRDFMVRRFGLLEDDSGRINFTAWKKSRMPAVRLGERVRFRNVARNWYCGRVSVALTGWSRVVIEQ